MLGHLRLFLEAIDALKDLVIELQFLRLAIVGNTRLIC